MGYKTFSITIIILIISFLGVLSFSTIDDLEITYELPKNVEDSIAKYININNKIDAKYLCLFESVRDTTNMLIIEFDERSKELKEVHAKSNRIIQINNKKIPLIFYTDLKFSSIFNKKYKEGVVGTTFVAFGGFRISFVGNFEYAKIVNYGFDQ